ncbi:MAG: c-type cytochrome [Gallionellaceae bacterium]|nr:c-type cytochrome [Gallionellaceae bacterium]
MKKALIVAGIAAFCFSATAFADPAADAKKGGCMNCHAADKKVVGPSFKDIAAKHKGDAGATDKLIKKTVDGGSGTFGPMPMPAQKGKLKDDELKAVITWILGH